MIPWLQEIVDGESVLAEIVNKAFTNVFGSQFELNLSSVSAMVTHVSQDPAMQNTTGGEMTEESSFAQRKGLTRAGASVPKKRTVDSEANYYDDDLRSLSEQIDMQRKIISGGV